MSSDFWQQLADRFTAIESDPTEFVACRRADNFVETGTRWLLTGSLDANSRFESLSRLALTTLGESDGPDAYARWLDRVCRDLNVPALQSSPGVIRGINLLAATLCQRYVVEAEIRARRTFPPAAEQTLAKRAAWLKQQLQKREFSEHHFAELSGADHRTVKKILNGKTVQHGVLDKIARALNCDVRDIPTD